MKIVANGVPLLSPRTGVGNYVYQMFRVLKTLQSVDVAFHYGLSRSRELKQQASTIYAGSREVVKRLGKAYFLYRSFLDLGFRAGQVFGRYDLYHETNYIPMPFSGPTVVTVFDLSFHLHPETHPPERIRFMERYFYPRLKRASRFITISEAVKQELVKHLSLPAEKVDVTYLGVDGEFRPVPVDAVSKRLTRYGLKPKSYVLYVGTFEPRKNIVTLLRGYAKLSRSMRSEYPLMLVGGKGWLTDGLDQEINSLGISPNVLKTGFVPTVELPVLYSAAAVFVFPSLYEGFGLPPVEAMACGAPVIVSDIPSLKEVVGQGGVLVPPRDEDVLSRQIERVLTEPEWRDALIREGIRRVSQFSWQRCAQNTLEVYRKCIAAN